MDICKPDNWPEGQSLPAGLPGWDKEWHAAWIATVAALPGPSARAGQAQGLFPARVTGLARSLVEITGPAGPGLARLSGSLLRTAREQGMPLTVGDWVVCRNTVGPAAPATTTVPAQVAASPDTPAAILAFLPRRTVIERKRAISGGRKIVNGEVSGGRTEAQAVAANVDLAFIVAPLGPESGPGEGLSRIERSMTLCTAGGVAPVVVYNKSDLVAPADLPLILEVARAVCPTVLAVSAHSGAGLADLRALLGPGRTAVFFGPSGAGKSSLVNGLMALDLAGGTEDMADANKTMTGGTEDPTRTDGLADSYRPAGSIGPGDSDTANRSGSSGATTLAQSGGHGAASQARPEATAYVPRDTGPLSQATGKGLHITTSRDLLILPAGGMIIDTPGMRELALWVDESALSETFEDLVALASQCRFSDCGHSGEPGCAIREALDAGELDPRRYENWRRMRGEVQRLDMRKIALWNKQQARAKRYFDTEHR